MRVALAVLLRAAARGAAATEGWPRRAHEEARLGGDPVAPRQGDTAPRAGLRRDYHRVCALCGHVSAADVLFPEHVS